MSRVVSILVPIVLACAVLLAPAAVAPAHGAGDLVYLALGDSVPSGADLPDGVGYPRRLGQQIADASGRQIELLNRAVSASTVPACWRTSLPMFGSSSRS